MANKTNLTLGGVIIALIAGYYGLDLQQKHEIELNQSTVVPVEAPQVNSTDSSISGRGADIIAHAFKNKLSNIQVEASGQVIAVLPDDNEGSRHQKFLLKLDNGQTLLVAHNIDLAPRIESLKKGATVQFNGEYEYSAKGGVMHWTHHDPNGRHVGGWLKHQGRTYQ